MRLSLPRALWLSLVSALLLGGGSLAAGLGPWPPEEVGTFDQLGMSPIYRVAPPSEAALPAEVAFRLPEPPPEELLPDLIASDVEPLEAVELSTPPPASPPVAQPLPTPTPAGMWRGRSSINYLVLGLDRRANELARPDAIMIGNIDLQGKRASVLSIPRDLIVSIPGYGRDRINTAFVYGELDRRTGGGAALLRQVVEQNFGVSLDHYAVLDFHCFRSVVDALGGVSVQVAERIIDPSYPTDSYTYKTVVFDKGVQQLDGARALEYVRTRSTTSDFSRMGRQQQVAAAIQERLLSLNALSSVPTIVGNCAGLSTDLGVLDLIGLALAARDIQHNDIALRVIEPPMVSDLITPLGAMMLQPRWELIRPVVQQVFSETATASVEAGRR